LAGRFPLLGRVGDLHPLEYVRAGRTIEKVRLSQIAGPFYVTPDVSLN